MPDPKMTIEEAFAELKRLYPKREVRVTHRLETQRDQLDDYSSGVNVSGEYAWAGNFSDAIAIMKEKISTPQQLIDGKRAQIAALEAEIAAIKPALEGKATP
jgi:hypothetical protein